MIGNNLKLLRKQFSKSQDDISKKLGLRKNSIPECFDKSISYSNDISKIQSADIYLICVSDDAIDSVNSQLNINEESIVIHSSGSTEMNCLSKHKKYGVLYPLQTFSLNSQVDFNNILL